MCTRSSANKSQTEVSLPSCSTDDETSKKKSPKALVSGIQELQILSCKLPSSVLKDDFFECSNS